jgi:hypothetical protein
VAGPGELAGEQAASIKVAHVVASTKVFTLFIIIRLPRCKHNLRT